MAADARGLVVVLALWGSVLFAQTVPFVGCESSGQVENLPSPKAESRALPISSGDAAGLAYYASADGVAVLGPRGWYCEGNSGSGGSALYLSPSPIRKPFEGFAIEFDHTTSENSGRYEIAEMMGRLFPEYRACAKHVYATMDSPLPARPYPHDILTYRGKTVVEFRTPPRTKGLGTASTWLRKNGGPVLGVVMLVGEGPDMVQVSVRLPRELHRLTTAIIRQAEREAAIPGH